MEPASHLGVLVVVPLAVSVGVVGDGQGPGGDHQDGADKGRHHLKSEINLGHMMSVETSRRLGTRWPMMLERVNMRRITRRPTLAPIPVKLASTPPKVSWPPWCES